MNNRYITPVIVCILLLVLDTLLLIQGLIQHQNGRVTLAGLALAGIIAYLYYILLCHNTNRLKPVRVRSRR